MGVRSRQIAGPIVLDSQGFLGAPVDFLQQALLAAKSDAQRPKTRIGQSELQIATY